MGLNLSIPVKDYDFLDHQDVIGGYYQDCERIVGEATGAEVWAFDHNIRSAGGLREKRQVKGGQDVQGPAHIVHGDYIAFFSGKAPATHSAA